MIFVLYAGAFYNEAEPLQTELELWTDHSFVLRQATSQYRDRIVGSYRIEQDTLYLKHSTGYTNYYLVEGYPATTELTEGRERYGVPPDSPLRSLVRACISTQ